ncbi:MAG: ABC transporter ATP-binding protein [Proteobacteria bacterium]|jgi:ABC-2 type transport system ATP-binding protein|nr:ABC transporter ATP-binding protein [Pseudomonadota bacterium]
MNVIELLGMERSFGDHKVLRGIDFSIAEGSITGLLGVNGTGKTTLINCVMGLLKADAGTCSVYGEDAWQASVAVRQRIGFVPQVFDGFEWMTVRQILDYTGAFYESWDPAFVNELVALFDLPDESKVVSLSVGMKQRVSIVLALGHRPRLLVLDEPVAALDPVGRRAFIELLLEMNRNENRTILFSTHITSDIERVAARVAILKDGEVKLHSDLEDLKQSYCRVHLHSHNGVERYLEGLTGCVRKEIRQHSARLTVQGLDPAWRRGLEDSPDVQIDVEDLNLDEIFVELNS